MRCSECILHAVVSAVPTGWPAVTQLPSLMVLLLRPIGMFLIIHYDVHTNCSSSVELVIDRCVLLCCIQVLIVLNDFIVLRCRTPEVSELGGRTLEMMWLARSHFTLKWACCPHNKTYSAAASIDFSHSRSALIEHSGSQTTKIWPGYSDINTHTSMDTYEMTRRNPLSKFVCLLSCVINTISKLNA